VDSQVFSADLPELIAPGHPLLSALIEAVGEKFGASLIRGIVLFDDRSSDDYVLVTAVVRTDGRPTEFDTYAVSPGGDRRLVCPGLYTSLEGDAVPASPDEVAAAEAAVAAIAEDGPDREIAAVAYVRGMADPATAGAWRAARDQLRDDLTAKGLQPVAALPGQGWDFTTGDDEVTFWSAAPPGQAGRRRAEKYTAKNVGAQYVVSHGP
jgi:hypothetical protein